MFRFTEPSHSDIQRFLAAATSRPLSYVDVGIASKLDPVFLAHPLLQDLGAQDR